VISWRASSAGSPQSLQSAGFFSHAAGPEDQRPLLGSDATQPIALQRIRHHAETAADYQRLLVAGKTTREARRCVKRALARHFYRRLREMPTGLLTT